MSEKWDMYMEKLQGHPSQCHSAHTKDSMGFVAELIPPAKYSRMLNIGAGEGLETKVLSELGYEVTGIVRGEPNLKYARTTFPALTFYDMDMHDLQFPNDSFDCIYMNQVFEHAFAPFIFLLEMNSVLVDGGLVFTGLPHFKEIDDVTANPDINWITHHHPNILCERLFRQFFSKTGFVVERGPNATFPGEPSPYFDNAYLLRNTKEKNVHSDVATALRARKENSCL